MAVVIPHTFVPGEDAAAAKVDENFQALAAAIEGIGAASTASDVYQSGVVGAGDWAIVGGGINAGSGALTYPPVGGSAWLPGLSGGLVRTFTPAAALALALPVKPGPGGFINFGFDLVQVGLEAGVLLVAGVEKASEAEAVAAPPPLNAERVRVKDLVVKNVGGVYSAVVARDRRPWARGANAGLTRTAGDISLGGLAALTGLSLRVECSGAPVRLMLSGGLKLTEAAALFGFRMDGAAVDGTTDGGLREVSSPPAGLVVLSNLTVVYDTIPAPGSHLFQVSGKKVGGEAVLFANAGEPLVFSVVEQVRSLANNGTS